MEEEVNSLSGYEKGMIVFDNFLGTPNRKSIDRVLIDPVYHNPYLITQIAVKKEKELFCLIKH